MHISRPLSLSFFCSKVKSSPDTIATRLAHVVSPLLLHSLLFFFSRCHSFTLHYSHCARFSSTAESTVAVVDDVVFVHFHCNKCDSRYAIGKERLASDVCICLCIFKCTIHSGSATVRPLLVCECAVRTQKVVSFNRPV